MGVSTMGQLENAVDRLLQRNAQLQDHCTRLIAEQEFWRQQRQDMLVEIEGLLSELELLREQQA